MIQQKQNRTNKSLEELVSETFSVCEICGEPFVDERTLSAHKTTKH